MDKTKKLIQLQAKIHYNPLIDLGEPIDLVGGREERGAKIFYPTRGDGI
jgi:hypothetical protein